MTQSENGFILDAKEDPHSPVYTGLNLEQLRADWLRVSRKATTRNLEEIAPISSIALVGAVRNHRDGKLNMRDETACRAIMKELLATVPLATRYKLDLYNLSEDKDIFSTGKEYDLVIFCNLRELMPLLQNHYQKLTAEEKLGDVLARSRTPVGEEKYGIDLDRAVADALVPSDILSGIQFSGIADEHKYYVTVSKDALKPDAYGNLAKKLKARFIASWGFAQFIHGDYFTAPAIYNPSQPPGQRLIKSDDYTLTQNNSCGLELIAPFTDIARQVMPYPPHISFAVRNDVLDKLSVNDRVKAGGNLLFGEGINYLEKLELAASLKTRRGRNQNVKSWEVARKPLATLRKKALRPASFMERAELALRSNLG